MDTVFGPKIRKNIQVYVDDIVAYHRHLQLNKGPKGNIQKGKSSQHEAKFYKMLIRLKWRKIFGDPLNT